MIGRVRWRHPRFERYNGLVFRNPEVINSLAWVRNRNRETVSLSHECPGVVKRFSNSPTDAAIGRVVEVAGYDHRFAAIFLGEAFNFFGVRPTLGIVRAVVNVGVQEHDFAAMDIEHELENTSLLAGAEHLVVEVRPVFYGKLR